MKSEGKMAVISVAQIGICQAQDLVQDQVQDLRKNNHGMCLEMAPYDLKWAQLKLAKHIVMILHLRTAT